MQSNLSASNVSDESRRRRHENRNPPPRWIFSAAGLVVLLLICGWGVTMMLMRHWAQSRPLDPGQNLIIAPGLQPLTRFPSPQLQIDPHQDLMAMRAQEDVELNQYGWIDRTNGVVRIPIGRAMDLIAERGLPATASNRPAAQSSEQLIRKRSQRR